MGRWKVWFSRKFLLGKDRIEVPYSLVDAPSILPTRVRVQAHHQRFYPIIFLLCRAEKNENKRKRGRDWPIFQK